MNAKKSLTGLVLGAALLATSACASKSDLDAYATKDEVSSMRAELMQEISKAQADAAAAQETAAAAAAAADAAAANAAMASEKADAIFQKSLRK